MRIGARAGLSMTSRLEVDGSGLEIVVAQQRLNGGKIGPVFHQMRSEAVAQQVWANAFGDARLFGPAEHDLPVRRICGLDDHDDVLALGHGHTEQQQAAQGHCTDLQGLTHTDLQQAPKGRGTEQTAVFRPRLRCPPAGLAINGN